LLLPLGRKWLPAMRCLRVSVLSTKPLSAPPAKAATQLTAHPAHLSQRPCTWQPQRPSHATNQATTRCRRRRSEASRTRCYPSSFLSSCQAVAPQKHHGQLANAFRYPSSKFLANISTHIQARLRVCNAHARAHTHTHTFQHGAPRRHDRSLASLALVEGPRQNTTNTNPPTRAIWTSTARVYSRTQHTSLPARARSELGPARSVLCAVHATLLLLLKRLGFTRHALQ